MRSAADRDEAPRGWLDVRKTRRIRQRAGNGQSLHDTYITKAQVEIEPMVWAVRKLNHRTPWSSIAQPFFFVHQRWRGIGFPRISHSRSLVIPALQSFPLFSHSRSSVIPALQSFPRRRESSLRAVDVGGWPLSVGVAIVIVRGFFAETPGAGFPPISHSRAGGNPVSAPQTVGGWQLSVAGANVLARGSCA